MGLLNTFMNNGLPTSALRYGGAFPLRLGRVFGLMLLAGALEVVGLLTLPALLVSIGWEGGSWPELLPAGLVATMERLQAHPEVAIAVPILAFAMGAALGHVRRLWEMDLMLAWQERLFLDALHGLTGGAFPAIARLSPQEGAHVLRIETERSAQYLYLGLVLSSQVLLLAAQVVVAWLLFGWAALVALVLIGAGFGIFALLKKRWQSLGSGWSAHSEALTNDIQAGLQGWESVLPTAYRKEWLTGFEASLRRYLGTCRQFYLSMEKTSAGIGLGGAAAALSILAIAHLAGVPGGGLLLLAVLLYRFLPRFKSWIRTLQEWIQYRSAFTAVARWLAGPEAGMESREGIPEERKAGYTNHPGELLPMRIEGLSFAYAPEHPVLHGLDLELPATGLVLLSGANGSGKTTLLRILAHLIPGDQGTWQTPGGEGRFPDFPVWGQQLQYLPASPYVWGPTIGEYLGDAGLSRQTAPAAELEDMVRRLWPERTVEAVLATETGEWGRRLSMGMRQKAALMRCLAPGATLYCLDEPSQHLDRAAQAGLVALLRERAASVLVVIATQDPVLLELPGKRIGL